MNEQRIDVVVRLHKNHYGRSEPHFYVDEVGSEREIFPMPTRFTIIIPNDTEQQLKEALARIAQLEGQLNTAIPSETDNSYCIGVKDTGNAFTGQGLRRATRDE